MERNRFTDEQVGLLGSNPYTAKVTCSTISFTTELKEEVWKQMQAGIPAAVAMSSMGYDPDMLGKSRINGLRDRIRRDVRSNQEFHTGRRPKTRKNQDLNSDGTPAVEELFARVGYLEEKLDFWPNCTGRGWRRSQRFSSQKTGHGV